jgi:hypothetical protein
VNNGCQVYNNGCGAVGGYQQQGGYQQGTVVDPAQVQPADPNTPPGEADAR